MQVQDKEGFSLAELLLVLLILANIAAFTIPKVLSANEASQKRTVFLEALAMLYDIQNQGVLEGKLVKNSTPADFILPRINAVKVCPADASTEGCFTGNWLGPSNENLEAGVVLASGMVVFGIKEVNLSQGRDGTVLDWNGSKDPNLEGEDQLYIYLCYDEEGTAKCNRKNTIVPHTSSSNVPANNALYKWIFN